MSNKAQQPIDVSTPEKLEERLREMMEENKRLASELQAKTDELSHAKDEIREIKAEGEGWLITTPSVTYEGASLGVSFKNGVAWVAKNREYEHGKVPHVPKAEVTALEKAAKLDPEAARNLAIMRERAKMSSSERLVELLVQDMHYTATYYDGNDPGSINRVLDLRAQQAKEAEDIIERARKQAELLSQPAFMGR